MLDPNITRLRCLRAMSERGSSELASLIAKISHRGGPQALNHSLASGGPKVQWNGAAAACRLLGNVPVAAALPDAVATVVQAATALLQSSDNLKASTQVFTSNSFPVRDHRKSLFPAGIQGLPPCA